VSSAPARPTCTTSRPVWRSWNNSRSRSDERDLGSAELLAEGFDPELVERVLRLVDTAEYKRRQYPPGPKISVRNFGRDRRLPITNAWRERIVKESS